MYCHVLDFCLVNLKHEASFVHCQFCKIHFVVLWCCRSLFLPDVRFSLGACQFKPNDKFLFFFWIDLFLPSSSYFSPCLVEGKAEWLNPSHGPVEVNLPFVSLGCRIGYTSLVQYSYRHAFDTNFPALYSRHICKMKFV